MLVPIASLVEPIQIDLVDSYGSGAGWDDGCVWWASLLDSQDAWAYICLDVRKGSPTCHRLFEGARHPSRPDAQLIELGSAEEGIIVPLWSMWLDSLKEKYLREEALEQLRLDLVHHGDPPHEFHKRVW